MTVSPVLTCSTCGAEHPARDPALLGRTDREHLDKAEDLAKACKIDVASAYSVLLGILTLKDVESLSAKKAPPAKNTPEGADVQPRQASDKPERRRTPRSPVVLPVSVAASRKGGRVTSLFLFVLCLALGATVVVLWQQRAMDGSVDAGGTLLRSTQIRTGNSGRVTEIRGPDPQIVLAAFCKLDTADIRYEPVEIAIPKDPGLRIGILRDPQQPEALWAIEIRRQEQAQQWIAGSGERRIRVTPAPSVPAGAPTIPVRAPR
jgi:hypothetical protein